MHLFKTLKQSNPDIWLLWLSVFLRMLSFGAINQVMVLFLQAVDISHSKIGAFMALTLVGDVLISYFLSWNADKIGRRTVLVIGTIMMFGSGVVFATQSNYWVLLLAAVLGVISPSGDETGPFKTIEEASIAHLTPYNHRPEVFAFHGMFSAVGNAIGSLISGIILDYLNLTWHWDLISCYRALFGLYSFVGIIKFFLLISLSEKCEIHSKTISYEDETTPLTQNENSSEDTAGNDGSEGGVTTFLESQTSRSTWNVASRLLVVFFLDSLGYGLMPPSWVVYYFRVAFKISATTLGSLFFFTSIVNTVTTIPSAFAAKLFGPVKAMIFTQAPSAIFFLLIAFAPNFIVASVLLVLNMATTAMDVVPRQILLSSVVRQEDLTKVMGSVNTVKTFARCIGPVFTGKLADAGYLYLCYIITGLLTLVADFILGFNFISLDKEILQKQKQDHRID